MSLRRLLSRRSLCLAFLAAALPAHAVEYQRGYLVDNVSLPTSQSQANTYAIDLDGDGGNDNNFGSMLAAFDSSGFAVADAMNAAIASGSIVHLLSLHSTDPLFANDPAAQTDWAAALTLWAKAQPHDGTVAWLDQALPEFERVLIRVALNRTHGHRQEAARVLGWGRNTLTRKLKELGMADDESLP